MTNKDLKHIISLLLFTAHPHTEVHAHDLLAMIACFSMHGDAAAIFNASY